MSTASMMVMLTSPPGTITIGCADAGAAAVMAISVAANRLATSFFVLFTANPLGETFVTSLWDCRALIAKTSWAGFSESPYKGLHLSLQKGRAGPTAGPP